MKHTEVQAIQWEAAKIIEAIDIRQAELIALAEREPSPEIARKMEQLRKSKKRITKTFF